MTASIPPTASATRSLSSEDGGFPPPCTASLTFSHDPLEHGGVFQHVWEDEEPDFAASDEDIFQLSHPTVPVGDCDLGHLAVHVVFCLQQLAPVHLSSCGLACHNMAFSLMQNLDRDTDRHLGNLMVHVSYV